MRRNIPVIASIALTLIPVCAGHGFDWKDLKSTHFIVRHTKDEKRFGEDVRDSSEGYYKSIPARLGIARFSQFWTWDNRVKILLYPDKDTFLKESGRRDWVRAMVDHDKREITSYKGDAGTPFVKGALPHELAHLVLRDFLGWKKNVPLWLEEGVAQQMEEGRPEEARRVMKQVRTSVNFLSVKTLTTLDVRRVRDRELVRIFYTEACSLVGFLIDEHGADTFHKLCKQLRDGKSLDDALKATYPTKVRNVGELNEAWKKFLE